VVEAEQQANGGGLPGPIGTQEAEHLALVDGECEPVDGVNVAVGFREVERSVQWIAAMRSTGVR